MKKYGDQFPLELAEEALRLTEENPDYVYEPVGEDPESASCVYVHEGQGSCLFGQAMVNIGVDPEVLANPHLNTQPIEGLLTYWGYPGFHKLRVVQTRQDCGAPWGSPVIRGALQETIKDVTSKVPA